MTVLPAADHIKVKGKLIKYVKKSVVVYQRQALRIRKSDDENNSTCSDDDDEPKFILDKWDQWFLSSDDHDSDVSEY